MIDPITSFADALPVLESHGIAIEALGTDEKTRRLAYRADGREMDRDGVIALACELAAKDAPAPLTTAERQELAQHESTIARGMRTFQEVGKALAEIRDKRLYRAMFPTFAAYCDERWNLGRSQAYRLIDASEVVDHLSPIGDILPTNEAQTRPMVGLDPDQQRQAWQSAVEASGGKPPTARHVEAAVKAQQAPADFAAWQQRAASIGLDLTMDAHGRFDVMSRETSAGLRGFRDWPSVIDHLTKMEQATARRDAKPNIPELAPAPWPAFTDDIRQAAGRLELLVKWCDGFLFSWPGESTGGMDPLPPDQARAWLRDDAPGLFLARLDTALPKDLERAGYYWESVSPFVIRHNDGWRGDAPTAAGALELARDRMGTKAANRRDAASGRAGERVSLYPQWKAIEDALDRSDRAGATQTAIELLRAVAGPDPRGVTIGALKLIESVMPSLPKTELQEDLSMAIADLNECEEGSEWRHWAAVGWALLDMEATP